MKLTNARSGFLRKARHFATRLKQRSLFLPIVGIVAMERAKGICDERVWTKPDMRNSSFLLNIVNEEKTKLWATKVLLLSERPLKENGEKGELHV